MLYRDLVHFEPIESVIQLRTADDRQIAAELVRSYVISDRMADILTHTVLPQLELDRPRDNKGILVVGNYGTGKSHLMSVVSALAEHADLLPDVRNTAVRTAAAPVAGRYKVVRAEIGGVERPLRDIVLSALEIFLAGVGTPYSFPPATDITNNKEPLIAAMAGFASQHPNMGVLFVLDELLDFLRTREERALILDLGFLRELGEVTAITPFRFMAGLQETLFDSPRFAFVAEQLRRVRDRFEQVRIAREDIAFVVAQRLLNKSDEQLARITEHLRQFTPLYPALAERLGEYARLFPIHPAYIDTFERVYIAEKREVLKTFSSAIRTILDRPVPENETGLISYDHYWGILTDNASLRTLPGVVEVVEKSNVLEGRIRNAFTRPALAPMALRIIHALSVHRLTTGDTQAPLGVTAEELRDQLCLWVAIPEAQAEFLADQVRVALREITRTVSGQYITQNSGNGQYYLDLKKDIDFDAKIAERGAFMETRDLNRFFFDALQQLLNLPTSVHVTGFRIWPYELPWIDHNVTRPGYLLFGPPNERSTAQPPRDFYLFVLPPFGEQFGRPRGDSDEVQLQFQGMDTTIQTVVRSYAGARTMANESPSHRSTYDDKATSHLRALMTWIRENFSSRLRIGHAGAWRTVQEVLARTRSSASRDPEELLRLLAAQLLSDHFAARYDTYPAFKRLPQPISEAGRPVAAMDAVRFLAGRGRTNQAIAVLDGLQLLDDQEHIRPLTSPYARHLIDLLAARGDTQVVNQGEIIAQVAGGLQPIFKENRYHLEPEWVAVVLLALVYDGQISLALGGNEVLDAGNIERAAIKAIGDLTDFRFYRRPKTLPLPVWTQIFEMLGLQAGLIRDETTRDDAVRALQARVQEELQRVVTWQSQVQGGLSLWSESLFTDLLTIRVNLSALSVVGDDLPPVTLNRTNLLPYIQKSKEFLESLTRFNTPGKLRNIQISTADVDIAIADREKARRTADLLDVLGTLKDQTAYLGEAIAVLPASDPWIPGAEATRAILLNEVRRLARGDGSFDLPTWRSRLETLRREYRTRYAQLHTEQVLGPVADDRRNALLRDPRVEQLKTLSSVDILNTQDLKRWGQTVKEIPACRDFHAALLEASPICPACSFRPSQAARQSSADRRLAALADGLDTIERQWHAALRENLRSDIAKASLAVMTAAERTPIDAYLARNGEGGPLPAGLIEAANQALRGVQTVTLDAAELLAALETGGLPCTLEQLKSRFESFLRSAMSGHDARNTRLNVEREQV